MGIKKPINTDYPHGSLVTKKIGCGQSSIKKVRQFFTSAVGICKCHQMVTNFFQSPNFLGAPNFRVSLAKNILYKIVSNFAPNKEGLCSIFPFIPNVFHSSSQWVPMNNPSFLNEKITQHGNQKGFSHH